MVRVLVLVDKHILEASLPVGADLIMLLQKLYRKDDQIVKVHRVCGEQTAHILGINFAYPDAPYIVSEPCATQIFLRRYARVLCPAYLRHDGARLKQLLVKVHVLEDMLDKALRIGRVINRKA